MRLSVFAAALLLVLSAGCFDQPDGSEQPLQMGYYAHYIGPNFTMDVELFQTAFVADYDLISREAWMLNTTWQPVRGGSVPYSWLIDGDGQVGRIDYNHERLDTGVISWAHQGAYMPLGLSLLDMNAGDVLEYRVQGQDATARIVQTPGRGIGLDNDAPKPGHFMLDPTWRYEFDNLPLPSKIHIPMAPYGGAVGEWHTLDRLVYVPWDPLPDVPAWPKEPRTMLPPRLSDFLFTGENDEAFGMGISYRDAIDALAREYPQILAAECIEQFGMRWSGHDDGNMLGVGGSDDASLFLQAKMAGGMYDFSWQYRAAAESDLPLTGETAWSFSEPREAWWATATCAQRDAAEEATTPELFLLAAWRLPSYASGGPCDLLSTIASPYWSPESPIGHRYRAGLLLDAVTGTPQKDAYHYYRGETHVMMDAMTGRWESMSLDDADAAAMDTGAWRNEERQPPVDERDPWRDAYTCGVTVEREGPPLWRLDTAGSPIPWGVAFSSNFGDFLAAADLPTDLQQYDTDEGQPKTQSG